MPFVEANIKDEIERQLATDPAFKEAWENSQDEYRILGEIIRLRKEKGLSQADLANAIGIKQQAISRMEQRKNSPTLGTLCSVLNVLGQEIVLKPKTYL